MIAAALALCAALLPRAFAAPDPSASAASGELSGRALALHAADRLTFGAVPADVRAIQSEGLPAWLEGQLAPAPEEPACERLAAASPAGAARELARASCARGQVREVMTRFWLESLRAGPAKAAAVRAAALGTLASIARAAGRRPPSPLSAARALCLRLVSVRPQPELAAHLAAAFRRADAAAALRVLVGDPAFREPASFRARKKTPFEFLVSALRVSGARVTDAGALAAGLPGLKTRVGRAAFLSGLFTGPPVGARADARALLAPGEGADKRALLAYVDAYLGGELEPETLAGLEARLSEPGLTPEKLAALVLSTPDFERR